MKQTVAIESVTPTKIRRSIKRYLQEKGASYDEAYIEAQVVRLEAQLRARDMEALQIAKRQRTIWRRQREEDRNDVNWKSFGTLFLAWVQQYLFRRSIIELAFARIGGETCKDVLGWIAKRDERLVNPFSFDACCEGRGIDPDALRHQLARASDPQSFAFSVMDRFGIVPESPDPLLEYCIG